jgi:CTP:molybdopterin cytidylyltransferase MocA
VRRAAIVLAAGRGERMGGPKAWLLVEDEPLLLLHAERARAAGCDRVVVVVSDTRIALALGAIAGVEVAMSREADQAGSLAIGVRALAAKDASAVMVTPVDALPATLATIALLFEALEHGARAATPRHGGRGGHPIACRPDVLAPYADPASPPASCPPLRDSLAALGDARVRVEVLDPAVGVDLDTPEDALAVTGALPAFWRPGPTRGGPAT